MDMIITLAIGGFLFVMAVVVLGLIIVAIATKRMPSIPALPKLTTGTINWKFAGKIVAWVFLIGGIYLALNWIANLGTALYEASPASSRETALIMATAGSRLKWPVLLILGSFALFRLTYEQKPRTIPRVIPGMPIPASPRSIVLRLIGLFLIALAVIALEFTIARLLGPGLYNALDDAWGFSHVEWWKKFTESVSTQYIANKIWITVGYSSIATIITILLFRRSLITRLTGTRPPIGQGILYAKKINKEGELEEVEVRDEPKAVAVVVAQAIATTSSDKITTVLTWGVLLIIIFLAAYPLLPQGVQDFLNYHFSLASTPRVQGAAPPMVTTWVLPTPAPSDEHAGYMASQGGVLEGKVHLFPHGPWVTIPIRGSYGGVRIYSPTKDTLIHSFDGKIAIKGCNREIAYDSPQKPAAYIDISCGSIEVQLSPEEEKPVYVYIYKKE